MATSRTPDDSDSAFGYPGLRTCLIANVADGFENPSDDVKVHSIQSKNTNGKISFAEDIDTPASKRAIEVNFCLYGKSNSLCGFARLFNVKAHADVMSSDAIKNFLKRIEMKETLSQTEINSRRPIGGCGT